MPRNLARLRFKPPRRIPPLVLSRIPPDHHSALENRLRSHVLELSKPTTALNVQVVVNSKWKQQPGKKNQALQYRPHTVRDLVDPEGTAKHGQIIYVFANVKTGQVIYSLVELLDDYHLDQLPFIGKHSKPPVLRPDEWAPHCVVTFPLAEQGLQAFRKLREFRRLHETAWNKTNPEWLGLPAKKRMQKIMNQIPNTSADLAEVLKSQEAVSEDMRSRVEEQNALDTATMDKLWARIHAQADASLAKDKRDWDNPEKLEQRIKKFEYQLGAKRNQNEEDQNRLKAAKRSSEVRLQKVLWARRKAEEFKQMQETLSAQAAPANEAGAEEKLKQLKEEIQALEVDSASDQNLLRQHKAEIAKLEAAFEAKRQANTRDHPVARSILPAYYKKLSALPAKKRIFAGMLRPYKEKLPQPFTMDVEIRWADLRNAEYAAGNWPAAVLHDTLPLQHSRQNVHFMNAEQYQQSVEDEVHGLIKNLERKTLKEAGLEEVEPEPETEKAGVWKYLPEVKNPFRRPEA
ncbi:hypothetical protein N0V90_001454 [Kalmusia sp. IMI 367209]|nr:hypothetical protein N0V90_001454 [Kalmusia sp. IMI 367209]